MLSNAAASSFTATPFSQYPSPNKALNTPKNYQTDQLVKDNSEESTDKEINMTNTLNLPASKFFSTMDIISKNSAWFAGT